MVLSTWDTERFRRARERAGLTAFEVAERLGLSDASVFDLESFDDELATVYCPSDLARFASTLGVSPANLMGIEKCADPLDPATLAAAIRHYCDANAIEFEEFENRCGWHVAGALQQPARFLTDYSIDGIRDVCCTLNVDWERFIDGL